MQQKRRRLPTILWTMALLLGATAALGADDIAATETLKCSPVAWDADREAFVQTCESQVEGAAGLFGTCDDVGDCGRRIESKCKQENSKGKSARLVEQQNGTQTCEGECQDGTIIVIACNKPVRRPQPQPTGIEDGPDPMVSGDCGDRLCPGE
jgi:hypothetical protein